MIVEEFEEIGIYDTSQDYTSSKILEKTRQLSEVHDALEIQKVEFARKIGAFERREEALHKKDLRLQDSLIKFNKFLQENESKRTRALKRCDDECRICDAKEKEISSLKDLLNAKVAEEKELTDKLSQNKKYRDYLKSVITISHSTSDDYPEIQDILDRYKTLKSTNDDLLNYLKKNTQDHEASRSSFSQFTKKSGHEILNMNNKIAALQKNVDQLNVKANKMESLDDGAVQEVTDLTAHLSQLFVVLKQMLGRIESRRSGKKEHQTGTTLNVEDGEKLQDKTKKALHNLEKFTEYMSDYKSIAQEWEMK
jgi:chromosome segregation ATPase